jgi:cytochrome c-type biogenesis protein CcmH
LALAAVLLVAVVVLVGRSQPDDSVAATTRRIAAQLKCPDCQGESVASSNTRIARDVRAGIRERLAAGQDEDDVLAYYLDRYPDANLQPSGDGIGIVAWAVPVVAIVVALGGLWFALRRWSRQPRLAATDDDERLVERARAKASR